MLGYFKAGRGPGKCIPCPSGMFTRTRGASECHCECIFIHSAFAYVYILHPVCECLSARACVCVHVCMRVCVVCGVFECVCTYACVEGVYIDLCAYAHKCLRVNPTLVHSCTSYIYIYIYIYI